MTITSFEVLTGYPRAVFTCPEPLGSEDREYEAQLRVYGDDDQDGPTNVRAFLIAQPGIGPMGSPYAFTENDFDAEAFFYYMDPKRVPRSDPNAPVWLATLRWKTFKSDEQKEDKDGEDGAKTSDPTQWKVQVRAGTRKVEEAVRDAKYIEGYSGSAHELLTGYEGPVLLSNMQPGDPPATRPRSLRVYELTNYHAAFFGQDDDDYLDKSNSDTVQFTLPDDTLITLEPFTALVDEIVWDWVEINQRELWRRTVVLIIDPETWRKEYLDRGGFARALDGDPDGMGGTYSAIDRPPGAPTVRKLVDENDNPVVVNLNGDGQPLSEGDDPVYGKWAILKEVAMAALPLG